MRGLGINRRLGVWGTLISGLILGAVVASSGASSPVEKAENYDCMSSCYGNYRVCLMSGKSQSYCQNQYQNCSINCMGGGKNRAGE